MGHKTVFINKYFCVFIRSKSDSKKKFECLGKFKLLQTVPNMKVVTRIDYTMYGTAFITTD